MLSQGSVGHKGFVSKGPASDAWGDVTFKEQEHSCILASLPLPFRLQFLHQALYSPIGGGALNLYCGRVHWQSQNDAFKCVEVEDMAFAKVVNYIKS